MDMYSASFVKAKLNYEIRGFGKGVGRGHKVGGFQQKGEVGIDEYDGIACEVACIDGHLELCRIFVL